MAHIDVPLSQSGFGQTRRADNWWVQPVVVFLDSLGIHRLFHVGRVAGPALQVWTLSFAVLLSGIVRSRRLVRQNAGWMPVSVTAAMLILWAPGGFRFTCYYYRGAYYKAFWADPPSCTVGEPRKTYLGERSFPLIVQNVHRYFLYLALVLPCDSCDATCGMRSGSTANSASASALSSCWLNLVLLTSLHLQLSLVSPSGRRLS